MTSIQSSNSNRTSAILTGAAFGGLCGAGIAYEVKNPYQNGVATDRLLIDTMNNWDKHLEKNVYPKHPEAGKIINRYNDLQQRLRAIDNETKLDEFVSEILTKEEQKIYKNSLNNVDKVNSDLGFRKSSLEVGLKLDKFVELRTKKFSDICSSREVFKRLKYEPEKLTEEMKQVVDKTKNSILKKYAAIYGIAGVALGSILAMLVVPKKNS